VCDGTGVGGRIGAHPHFTGMWTRALVLRGPWSAGVTRGHLVCLLGVLVRSYSNYVRARSAA
jgi:hypothetical protein